MTSLLSGITGRVTFVVLVVSAALFSALATAGFVQIADSGRDAIRERVDAVLDGLEQDLRAGGSSLEVTTADGVRASVVTEGGAVSPREGEVIRSRTVELAGREVHLVGRASDAALSRSLRSLHRGLWVAVPVACILAAVMAGLATRRALRPVEAITDLAAGIGERPGSERVPVPRLGDEIEHLADTFNQMLDRLDRAGAAQRRFTSDAAHELRGPLMALSGELELAGHPSAVVGAETLDRLTTQATRLQSRVDDLVLLATLDEGRRPQSAPVDLLALLADEAAAVDAEVGGEPATVVADEALVRRAVSNLLANARRHAIETVSVVVERGDDRVWIHVDDDGPGIDPAERDRVFERFTRLDEARSTDRGGSGLGLAIVASVATAGGGGVTAGTSPLGGARVSVWLPTR